MDNVLLRNNLVLQKLLRCEVLDDLIIYTYTDRCVQQKDWDEITINSRGHVFNRFTGECVARPFPKFFNMNERPETQEKSLPWKSGYEIFEKLDGWLGTLYRHDGKYSVATRGSFRSEMAIWATKYLQEKFPSLALRDDITLVFEIIHPKTKIIVDYHGQETLKLLAGFNRHTGEEYSWHYIMRLAEEYGFEVARRFDCSIDRCLEEMNGLSGKEAEGFVVRFENGLRVKIKTDDYIRLAKIRREITPLNIWGAMIDGYLPASYFDGICDEYKLEVMGIEEKLSRRYFDVSDNIYSAFKHVYRDDKDKTSNRKKFASRVVETYPDYMGVLFSILDEKTDYVDKYIMGIIRPDNNIL